MRLYLQLKTVRHKSNPDDILTDMAFADHVKLDVPTIKKIMVADSYFWIKKGSFFNPEDILSWIYHITFKPPKQINLASEMIQQKYGNLGQYEIMKKKTLHYKEIPLNVDVQYYHDFARLGLIAFDGQLIQRTELGFQYFCTKESMYVDRLPEILTKEANLDLETVEHMLEVDI